MALLQQRAADIQVTHWSLEHPAASEAMAKDRGLPTGIVAEVPICDSR